MYNVDFRNFFKDEFNKKKAYRSIKKNIEMSIGPHMYASNKIFVLSLVE